MRLHRYHLCRLILALFAFVLACLAFFGPRYGLTLPQSARAVFPYTTDVETKVVATHNGPPELRVYGLTDVWLHDNVHLLLPPGRYVLLGPWGARDLPSGTELTIEPLARDVEKHVIHISSESCHPRQVEARDSTATSFLGLSMPEEQALRTVHVSLSWAPGTESPCPMPGEPKARPGFRASLRLVASDHIQLRLAHSRPYVLLEGVAVATKTRVLEVASSERAVLQVREPILDPVKAVARRDGPANVTLQFGLQGDGGGGRLVWRGRFSALQIVSGGEGGTLILRDRELVQIPGGMQFELALGDGTLLVEMSREGMRVDASATARRIKRGQENLAASLPLMVVEWFRPVEAVVAGGGFVVLEKLLRLMKRLARWLRK